MKKAKYMAPATEINIIQIQPLLNTVSNVDGDAGITPAEPTDPVPEEADSRRRTVWDDEEDF